jgi:CubicO group peptidase (beta-lactamase class C family)
MRMLCSLVLLSLTGCTAIASQSELQEYVRAAGELGIDGQVIVERNGQRLTNQAIGFANRERDVAVTTETTFGIASQTKSITSAAILILEAQGKLRVEDPIGKFIPDVPDDKSAITLHQLMTHTSGLPPGDLISDFEKIAPEELTRLILAQPLAGVGTWRYSNAGYNLLAVVIEKASGKRYEQFLRDEIFAPLGMRRTGVIGIDRAPDGAVAYRGFVPQGSISDWPRNTRTWGAGDVYSTAGDLLRFVRALRSGKLLPEAQKEKMFARHVVVEGEEAYGYGWFVTPEMIQHGGDTERGFHSSVRMHADGVNLILTGNRTEVNGVWQRWLVQDALADLAHGKEVRALPLVSRGAGLREGRYVSLDGGEVRVRHDGRQVVVEALTPAAALDVWGVTADREQLALAVRKVEDLFASVSNDPRTSFERALTESGKQHIESYMTEWSELVRTNGRLSSHRVRGALPRGKSARVFVDLEFDRTRVPMTVILQERGGGRLAGTRPGEGPPLARVFAGMGRGRLVAFDFTSGESVVIEVVDRETAVIGGRRYRRDRS